MKDRYNFATKLHVMCTKDAQRPMLACVHFSLGFAYATNGHAIIRQSLEFSSVLGEVQELDGKALHKNSYRDILKYDTATVTPDGVECESADMNKAFFPFHDLKNEKVPDFDSQFKNLTTYTPKSFIGVSPEFIDMVMGAMYLPVGQMRMSFIEGGKRFYAMPRCGKPTCHYYACNVTRNYF